jgi:glyceraldehyde-3-phosphate dehydrogenase/erythrose-4-phosphate dehydrogenase
LFAPSHREVVPIAVRSTTDSEASSRRARSAAINIVPTSTGAAKAGARRAGEGRRRGIMEFTEDPLVSTDIIGSSFSSIVDGG